MSTLPLIGKETNTLELQGRCMEQLRSLLQDNDRITRVHAAESLILFGEPAGIAERYQDEWSRNQNEIGYRAVVMRVLQRADGEGQSDGKWKRRIWDLFCNRQNPDRLHAIECLAKLGGPIPADALAEVRSATMQDSPAIAAFAHWALAEAGEKGHEDALRPFLTNSDPAARYCAAFVLRHRCPLSEANQSALRAAAESEQPGAAPYSYLNAASFVAAEENEDADESQRARAVLVQLLSSGSKDEIREACAAFGAVGNEADVALLAPLLEHAHPDAREGAAHAILEIIER